MADGAPSFLTGKTAGMPRWLWFALIGGGVIAGLYIRARRKEQAAVNDAATPDSDTGADPNLAIDSGDPGLAGVGVASPVGGVIPVQSPVVPEGFGDVVGALTGVIASQSADKTAAGSNTGEILSALFPNGIVTGGGAPDDSTTVSTSAKKTPKKIVKPSCKASARHGAVSCKVVESGGYWYTKYYDKKGKQLGHAVKGNKSK